MSLQIFLCHAKEDRASVKELYTKLKKSGFRPWIDEVNLHGGQEWEVVIGEVVRSSDIVIVCLSNKSTTKQGFVQKEIRVALDAANERPPGKTYLIPVRLEDCDLPRELRRWHAVDLFNRDGYSRLRKSLSQLLVHQAMSHQQSTQTLDTNHINNFLDRMDRLWANFDRVYSAIPRNDHWTMARYSDCLDSFFIEYWKVFDHLVRKKANQKELRDIENQAYEESQHLLEKVWAETTKALLNNTLATEKDLRVAKDLLNSVRREPNLEKRIRSYGQAAELLRGGG